MPDDIRWMWLLQNIAWLSVLPPIFFEWIALGREVLLNQCTHQLLRVYLWLEAGMFIRCL